MSILNRIVAFLGNPGTQRPDTDFPSGTSNTSAQAGMGMGMGDHFTYRPEKERPSETVELSRHPQELVQDARVPHRRRTAEEDY